MSLAGQVGFGKLNPFGWLRNLTENDLAWLTISGVPTNGTSGTFVKVAGKGALLTDVLTGNQYINTGTKLSPTWTLADGVSVLQTATVLITNTQIKNCRATPVTIIPAPGTGLFVYPVECIIELVYGGSNAFTAQANDNLALKWQDGSTTAIQQGGVQAFLQNTASAFNKFVDPAVNSDINVLASVVSNKPLVMHNISAAEIAGNAANNNTINVIVKYAIHPVL